MSSQDDEHARTIEILSSAVSRKDLRRLADAARAGHLRFDEDGGLTIQTESFINMDCVCDDFNSGGCNIHVYGGRVVCEPAGCRASCLANVYFPTPFRTVPRITPK